jgi:hypothetical protein
MSQLTATASPSHHSALCYFVLSHLDLGPDAASLYRPRATQPRWSADLLAAYCAAPGRLGVHFAPLRVSDIIALFGWLERPPAQMATPADRALCDALYGALECEAGDFEERWRQTCASDTRCAEVTDALGGLDRAMQALWARRGQRPPVLSVWDAPELGARGRGWMTPGHQRVATSLSEPIEHVLCQVLHEAIHPVSDLEVGLVGRAARETHTAAQGYDTHRAIEVAAVTLGAELIADHAPTLRRAYARWCDEVGMCPEPREGR